MGPTTGSLVTWLLLIHNICLYNSYYLLYVHLGNETESHTNMTAYIIKRKVRQHIRRFSKSFHVNIYIYLTDH